MEALETLLAQPPDAPGSATPVATAAAAAVAILVPEGGYDEGEEGDQKAEPLPSAWDPSDWWGEDEEAAARHSSSPRPPSTPALEHEALSSRRPPTHPQPPPMPRPWNPESSSGTFHASLSADRLTAHYVGKGANHPQDVGTVKADNPLPRRRDCYYFEVWLCL
jgi:hypothetical protein